jgi:hypothetical protein
VERGNPRFPRPLCHAVPDTAMFLTVLALNFIGDRVRAHLEVRESAL